MLSVLLQQPEIMSTAGYYGKIFSNWLRLCYSRHQKYFLINGINSAVINEVSIEIRYPKSVSVIEIADQISETLRKIETFGLNAIIGESNNTLIYAANVCWNIGFEAEFIHFPKCHTQCQLQIESQRRKGMEQCCEFFTNECKCTSPKYLLFQNLIH